MSGRIFEQMPHVLLDSDMMEARRLAGNARRKGWEEERDEMGRVVLSEEKSTGSKGGRKAYVQRDGPVSWARGELKSARALYRARALRQVLVC